VANPVKASRCCVLITDEIRTSLSVAGGFVTHLGVETAHGIAHVEIPVVVTGPQTVFIAVVMYVAPLMALGLLATDHRRAGGEVLAVSMVRALVFSVIFHYVPTTPDNVVTVPARSGQDPFRLTAALLVPVDVASIGVDMWLMRAV
jgi:amino acid permease